MKKIVKNLFEMFGYKIEKYSKNYKLSFSKRKHNIERFVPIEDFFLGRKIYIHDIASFNMCIGELFQSEAYKFKANNSKPYIIDCGANLGMSIIYFKELYPEASILAFEADSHIFSFLEKNIFSFDYEDVILVNKAVWNKEGDVIFYEEGGAGGKIEEVNELTNKHKSIPSTRLKKYLKGKKVDFLKLDIEGAEYEVLKDCSEELNNVDFLFVEYHSIENTTQNLHSILQIIQNAGFRYHIKEAHTSKYPFIHRELNYGMDLQLNLFCYKG